MTRSTTVNKPHDVSNSRIMRVVYAMGSFRLLGGLIALAMVFHMFLVLKKVNSLVPSDEQRKGNDFLEIHEHEYHLTEKNEYLMMEQKQQTKSEIDLFKNEEDANRLINSNRVEVNQVQRNMKRKSLRNIQVRIELNESKSIYHDLVKNEYERYYKPVLEACPKGVQLENCVSRFADSCFHLNCPIWMESIFTQMPVNGLFGHWHALVSDFVKPHFHLCTIEKIGTTQWRKVFTRLNRNTHLPFGPQYPAFHPSDPSVLKNWRSKVWTEEWSPWVVLRDPLERFLSAYLNKCEDEVWEGHCEPTIQFTNNETWHSLPKRQRFHDFIMSTPRDRERKWNVHFMPQSLYCDGLYRHEKYNKIVMNSTFYTQLESMVSAIGVGDFNKVDQAIDGVFHYKNSATQVNVGVETRAADRAKEYYTSETAAQVLKFYSLDYIMLEIPLPKWLDQI